ncbi:MAG: hypothetical protein A3G93_11915 [Nitrospinae bacterium RIFCSPLOWO2_12_FULL_45_22]|nr:MAG: hypothetical protein A3G93_11915 [Nitrospinae bacterium RIFCSPLOWO2_12_FULL_45_22]
MALTKKRIEANTRSYDHKDAESLLRPDIGLQAQFKKKRPPMPQNKSMYRIALPFFLLLFGMLL